ncbi:hypothetical protein D9M68_866300 [compost metagenome]
MQGRTGTEDITHIRFPAGLQPVGQVAEHQLFGFHPTLLDLLHIAALLRHGQLAIPARRDLTLAQGVFVDIAHLAAGQTHQAALDQPRGQLACGARADGVDPGMDLHPGGNAQHRLAFAHGGADIARRAIAAGKQNQRNAGILQEFDRLAGIRRAARPIMQLPEHPVTEAHLGQ